MNLSTNQALIMYHEFMISYTQIDYTYQLSKQIIYNIHSKYHNLLTTIPSIYTNYPLIRDNQ